MLASKIFERLRKEDVTINLQEPTLEEVATRCSVVWHFITEKLRCKKQTTNAWLVPDLMAIEKQMALMATMVDALRYLFWRSKISRSACLKSLLCLEAQCQSTVIRVQGILRLPEWTHIPEILHEQLQAYTDDLRRQGLDLAIMHRVVQIAGRVISDSAGFPRPWDVGYCPRDKDVEVLIRNRLNLLKRGTVRQKIQNASTDALRSTNDDCWSSTQSSIGIMAPATGVWSDDESIVSDATETGHESHATFARSSAGDHPVAFAELLNMGLNKTRGNKDVETVVNEEWSKYCSGKGVDPVNGLRGLSCQPLQAEHAKGAAAQDNKDDSKDEALEAILNRIGSRVTEADIAELVFLWTKAKTFFNIKKSGREKA